jgi:hypothetical protein
MDLIHKQYGKEVLLSWDLPTYNLHRKMTHLKNKIEINIIN